MSETRGLDYRWFLKSLFLIFFHQWSDLIYWLRLYWGEKLNRYSKHTHTHTQSEKTPKSWSQERITPPDSILFVIFYRMSSLSPSVVSWKLWAAVGTCRLTNFAISDRWNCLLWNSCSLSPRIFYSICYFISILQIILGHCKLIRKYRKI